MTGNKDSGMTYFMFRPLRLRKDTMVILMSVFLGLALFMERFCFVITVYKTKYYGYVLILIVIALNCIFNFVLSRLRREKTKKRLHELFNIERKPNVDWCVIGIIGALDMLYAFFLFWPANVMPVWTLVTLL
jgi:MFS superfamily sulfate permease-like transporter